MMENSKGGFTLIEMLVVVAIIGLLSSIVIASTGSSRKTARDSKRQAELRQVLTAMAICYEDVNCGNGVGVYPGLISSPANLDSDETPCLLCPMPKDPSGTDYTWVDNRASTTAYCIYTPSESDLGKFYAVSHKGMCFGLSSEPVNYNCWSICQ